MKKVRLATVAEIERAQDKIYPAGCTLIVLSAAHQNSNHIRYMAEAAKVEERFAVVIPHKGVIPEFLYAAIKRAAPEFFHNYQTGINLQYDVLAKYYKVEFTEDLHIQQSIVDKIKVFERAEQMEEEIINTLKEFKRTMLSKMFPR